MSWSREVDTRRYPPHVYGCRIGNNGVRYALTAERSGNLLDAFRRVGEVHDPQTHIRSMCNHRICLMPPQVFVPSIMKGRAIQGSKIYTASRADNIALEKRDHRVTKLFPT